MFWTLLRPTLDTIFIKHWAFLPRPTCENNIFSSPPRGTTKKFQMYLLFPYTCEIKEKGLNIKLKFFLKATNGLAGFVISWALKSQHCLLLSWRPCHYREQSPRSPSKASEAATGMCRLPPDCSKPLRTQDKPNFCQASCIHQCMFIHHLITLDVK